MPLCFKVLIPSTNAYKTQMWAYSAEHRPKQKQSGWDYKASIEKIRKRLIEWMADESGLMNTVTLVCVEMRRHLNFRNVLWYSISTKKYVKH